MLDQNTLLEENGWDIVPFAMEYDQNFATEYDDYFVEEIDFASDYKPVEKFRKVVKSVYSLEARREISRLIDDVRPSIVHSHNVYHHLTPAIFGAIKKKDVPSVMTVHDLKIGCPSKLMLAPDGVCERCKGGKTWNAVGQSCLKARGPYPQSQRSRHRCIKCSAAIGTTSTSLSCPATSTWTS